MIDRSATGYLFASKKLWKISAVMILLRGDSLRGAERGVSRKGDIYNQVITIHDLDILYKERYLKQVFY